MDPNKEEENLGKESKSLEDGGHHKKINLTNIEDNKLNNNNIQKNNNSDHIKDKKNDDRFDEIAKNITKNIMNLGCNENNELETNYQKFEKMKIELNKKKSNLILTSSEKLPKGTKKEKGLLEDHKMKDNINKKIINPLNIDKDKKEEEPKINNSQKNKDNMDEDNPKPNFFLNDDNIFENKQIDETTKNTINDILEYVLNEMKSNKRVYKRKYSQRNKRFRINEQKKIEIIVEEDKESSTSEICKEKLIRDSISSLKDNMSFKDDLRESHRSKSIAENIILDAEKIDSKKQMKIIDKNLSDKKKIK